MTLFAPRLRRPAASVVAALLLTTLCAPARAADAGQSCDARRAEVGKKAASFKGDERINRLIQADLTRAARELAEGDVDECTEALDHAEQLLAGKY